MFPNICMGSLNGKLLKRMVLTQKQMEGDDAVLFYQLLLPIWNSDKSDIRDDPCKTFYNVVSKCTNRYAVVDEEHGTDYGCLLRPTNAADHVNFDAIVFQKGKENLV